MSSALRYCLIGLVVFLIACGSNPKGDGDGDGDGDNVDSGVENGADANCAQSTSEAVLTDLPVDIIFVIDNSGSMGQEIQGVQDNINQNFAGIIEASMVDYRVIMLTQHGPVEPDDSVCIEGPLSGIPMGGCVTPPVEPVSNPPRFYHYSFSEVGSHSSWCKVLDKLSKPDEFNQFPNGLNEVLRPEAFKIFVEVTDDGMDCSLGGNEYNDNDTVAGGEAAAAAFDAVLTSTAPEQFGTPENRNYRWYSIVAMANRDPNNPAAPWLPTDPLTIDECPTSEGPGTGHQALSVMTGGLRFSLCEPSFYNVIFNEIAQGVINKSAVACEFEIPPPPSGEMIDYSRILVEYTSGAGVAEEFGQVIDRASCEPNHFFIEDNQIVLCDSTCSRVQADDAAKVNVVFNCTSVID